jgi:DNA gyrase/topoisomerase IV subunit A
VDEDRPEELQRLRDEMRLEIVEGLLDALAHWDEVCAVVGAAGHREEAVASLRGPLFGYQEQVAQYVLDMRIAMRTASARRELEDERRRLAAGLGR